jgi:cytoskeletal protein RodZ
VICPKCGEDNSDNFRFCGMCGTLLESRLETRVEARRGVSAPSPDLPQGQPKLQPRTTSAPEPWPPVVIENATRPASNPVPSQVSPNHPSPSQPSMDSLREKAFSGLDSFFEPEQPKTGGRRILLLVVLLAALGAAGWWTYTNLLGVSESRKPETATPSAGEAPAETPSAKPMAKDAAPAVDAGSSQAAVPSTGVANSPAESPSPPPETSRVTAPKPTAPALTPKISSAERRAAKSESTARPAKAARLPAPPPPDTGDAEFRKAEAYLYGRGASANCDQAVKYLKAASAKSSGKARSAFGTMYATGHCVARDLPTSYLWFALALRVDPDNQILEKDLSAIWNQMTPPERQMATRMKQ